MVLNHECYIYCDDYEEKLVVIVEHLSKMRHLRLLIMKCVNTSGNISCLCLSNELRYVEWDSYPFKYLPLSFQPNQLVELILKSSSIEKLWKGKKVLILLVLIFSLRNINKLETKQSNVSIFVDFSCHSICPI